MENLNGKTFAGLYYFFSQYYFYFSTGYWFCKKIVFSISGVSGRFKYRYRPSLEGSI